MPDSSLQRSLRKSVTLFRIAHFFTKVKQTTASPDVITPDLEWKLWLARPEKDYPDWLVLDKDNSVNERTLEACFVSVREEQIEEVLKALPVLPLNHRDKVCQVASSWGWCPSSADESLTSTTLAELNIVVTPVPRLKDPSCLRDFDWAEFVDKVVAYGTDEKDPRLRLIHKTRLLRGIDMGINPHGLEVTNPGTGKSTFYDVVGENFGKITAKTFLGFAKSPVEVFPGIIDRTELPIACDQIESQSAHEIMRFMFNALEYGADMVGSGSARFRVRTSSIFNLLANPIGYEADRMRSFATLVLHLSSNPALGRRFGTFLFGTDFKKMTKKPKPEELRQWRLAISEFRAVEEYARPKLRELVHSPDVWNWINSSILDYSQQIEALIRRLDDETVRAFIQEHATGAQARVRGAALYAALVDHLADLALEQLSIPSLLDTAEAYLGKIVEVNLQSIANIAREWAHEKSAQIRVYFQNLPDYLKEIVSAVELYRRTRPARTAILLRTLPFRPSKESYPTLQTCLRKLAKLRRRDQTLDMVKRHFGIDLVETSGSWLATLLAVNPVEEIVPVGALDRFDQIDHLTNDSSTTTPSNSSDRNAVEPNDSSSNGQNGQNGQHEVVPSGMEQDPAITPSNAKGIPCRQSPSCGEYFVDEDQARSGHWHGDTGQAEQQ